jgi:CHAD domain-containing protein
MPFEIVHAQETAGEVMRILHEELDLIFQYLKHPEDPHKAIHDTRKKLKKLRALARLVRFKLGEDTYQEANANFRDAARKLSLLRDATARLETLDKLQEVFGAALSADSLAEVREHLQQSRSQQLERYYQEQTALEVMALLTRQRIALQQWQLPFKAQKSGFQLFEGGLHKIYRQGRRAFHRSYLDPTVDHFHDWRKRVKYLRHQIELLIHCWPEQLQPLRASLHHLGELLGDDHDLAVFEEIMETEPGAFPEKTRLLLAGLLKQRSEMLRKEAFFLGQKIYTEKPSRFVARIGAYWQSWEWESSNKRAHIPT